MSDGNPQAEAERRAAARHLLMRPLTCEHHDPEIFRLIRRHEVELSGWFTQRLGYRLHLDADTARLYKTGAVIERRPLTTATGRPFNAREYTYLALALAANAAGPSVVSLRDLVGEIRSAAVEAGIDLTDDASDRRALVTALRWMIDQGLAIEMHEHVDRYASDAEADAVIKVRPDRIALVLVAATAGASTAGEMLARAERRQATRQWMRVRLLESPVLYRHDLSADEWSELRRRLGEEARLFDEMFGLVIESRAEGVAMIDPAGTLSDRRFPTGGTLGHAALLVVESLLADATVSTDNAPVSVPLDELVVIVGQLAARHHRRWSRDLVERPDRLSAEVVDLLIDLDLARHRGDGQLELLPAAARYAIAAASEVDESQQGSLWEPVP